MGKELTLLIVDGYTGPREGHAHTILDLKPGHYDVLDKLDKKARTIPGFKLATYMATIPNGPFEGEQYYGEVSKTPYGEPITYVSAEEFVECFGQKDLTLFRFALAALAYVRALKSDTLIGLWYH